MRRFAYTLALSALFGCTTLPPLAQPQEEPPAAADVVRWWLDGSETRGREEVGWLPRVLNNHHEFSSALVEGLLDELVLAAQVGDERGNKALKQLGLFSVIPYSTESERDEWYAQAYYPGVVERIASVYPHVDRERKRWILSLVMPLQADREAATRFLEEAAATETGDYDPDEPMMGKLAFDALEALLQCGPEGRLALSRLHARGPAVAEPALRRGLEALSKTDFRRP